MKKYMKYEIKGTYKFILGILIVVLIASTVIQMNALNQVYEVNQMEGSVTYDNSTGFQILLVMTAALVIFGAYITAFFYIIGSFRKELYENRGYLTFTLPLTGNQILGSKLLVSMLWYFVLGAGMVIYNMVLALILFGNDWKYLIEAIGQNLNSGIITLGLTSILSTAVTLILIYFSITLSRVSIRNKKIGGIWFIVFIVLNMLFSYLSLKIGELLPYYFSFSGFELKHIYDLNLLNPNSMNNMGSMIIMGPNFRPYLNIFGNLFQILVIVGGFLGTGYLLEKKVDI